MTTVEFIDHLTTIFFDLVMPAIGVWIVYLVRQMLARGVLSVRPPHDGG